jgi:archaellum component FlaC
MVTDNAEVEAQGTWGREEKCDAESNSNISERVGQNSSDNEYQQVGISRTYRTRLNTFTQTRTMAGGILVQLVLDAKEQLERYDELSKTLKDESEKTQHYINHLESLLEQLQQQE